jgi:hypothetical protein
LWLLEQGVRATGYVRAEGRNVRLAPFVTSFNNVVEYSRAVLRDRILRALPGKVYANVIVALVVGDQRGIGQSDWLVFTRTGISHLIRISGLSIHRILMYSCPQYLNMMSMNTLAAEWFKNDFSCRLYSCNVEPLKNIKNSR